MEISILPIACWKQSIQTENLPITIDYSYFKTVMLRCMLLHRLILYAQVQGHQTHMYNFHVHRKVIEHGIQRSEVPFPKGTEDFFFVP